MDCSFAAKTAAKASDGGNMNRCSMAIDSRPIVKKVGSMGIILGEQFIWDMSVEALIRGRM